MAAQTRKAIKARMKSVRNTRKITKAMELVAASKMRRAIAQTMKSRPFAKTLAQALAETTTSLPENITHRLLHPTANAKKTLFIVFSSDRGLAGGLNVNIAKLALAEVRALSQEDVEVVAVGRKGGDALQRAGVSIVARFSALSNHPTFADLLPVARLALEGFMQGTYREVRVIYTDFVSGISQRPAAMTLLPVATPASATAQKNTEALFEPSPAELLERLLPMVAETLLWQSLLESVASEHASRMLAMKNASDAAGDMLSALSFTYNQARQSAITQEIAEISSGKAALE